MSLNSVEDAGFTLLETLIALIILSLASLAMMQSTVSMMSSSEKAIYTSQKAVEGVLQRKSYARILNGFIKGWGGSTEVSFKGSGDTIITRSTVDSRFGEAGVRPMSISLSRLSSAELYLEVLREEERLRISKFPAKKGRFYYLGKDRIWYPSWPPGIAPSSGVMSDNLLSQMPEFPEAIMLELTLSDNTIEVWVESIERSGRPLFVSDDF